MNLDSEHDSSRLDEDAIYYALSTYWKLTYKKIDPLKLDLNIKYATTIPKNFALKHLILPIEVVPRSDSRNSKSIQLRSS